MKLLILFFGAPFCLFGQAAFANPIIEGEYPDPSNCRMHYDSYIAYTPFEYFPGLPIHYSNDLVNWTLVD